MGSPEFNRKWKLFFNGLVQTMYSAAAASLATFTIDGVFRWWSPELGLDGRTMLLIVLGSVVGAVIGYFQRSPLPDLFEVTTPAKLVEVVEVADAAEKEIAVIAEKANEDIAEIVK